MLATARNDRSPTVKNSASSPPAAGSVAQGSKRPPARLSSSSSGSLSPPFIPGGPPGMSLASCGLARGAWVPTRAGRALVEHAERILVELRSAEATLAGAGTRITGLLRVGIPFREGPHIMSRALTEVRRRFPDMEIRLAAISDEDGPDAVHREQLDMAIVSRYGNARETARPGLREWTLGHDPLRLCVPPNHR